MNIRDFKTIASATKRMEIININDLEDQSNRTLLYGYTCDRDTWHVYIKDEKIYLYTYDYKENNTTCVEINTLSSNEQYIPDKRLYPECCDYEFCVLLKLKEIHLPFTSYDSEREFKQYYGKVYKEE